MEKNVFGNHPVSMTESRSPPPAFSSDPLINRENHGNSDSVDGFSSATGSELPKLTVGDIIEIDGANSAGNFMKASSPVAVRGYFQCTVIVFAFIYPLKTLISRLNFHVFIAMRVVSDFMYFIFFLI